MPQDRVVTQPQPQNSQAQSQQSQPPRPPAGAAPTSEPSSGAALQGEGNYDAARRHRESAEAFVKSGQVGAAARQAAPHDDVEAREMAAAEEAGKSHAKGEDPALQRARDRQE